MLTTTRGSAPEPSTDLSPIEVILVGVGHRTVAYASYAEHRPDLMRVVGVVDPDPVRRESVADRFDVPADRRYDYVSDLPQAPLARAAINGTMDALHVPTSLELLDRGYDLLLEKPIALDPATLLQLQRRADERGRVVVVCHVLRHAPFLVATVRIRQGRVLGRSSGKEQGFG